MRATRVWAESTARPVTTKVLEWVSDMVDRWGDDRVADAIEEQAPKGDFNRLLSRVQDQIAREDLRRPKEPPIDVGREWLLGIVRGEREPPSGPWIHDNATLSAEEYGEVIAWTERRRSGRSAVNAGDQS